VPYLILFIATILGANWAIQVFGLVPVGPNLLAPAGVYFAGLAFTFRDLAQEKVSRGWIIAAIVAGAVLSAAVSTKFAVASGIAFLISELLDFAVYTPLRRRNWIGAVVASNVVGLVADSLLFLALAFGSLQYLSGQVIGKAWMTLLAVAVLWLLRRRLAPGENGGDAAPAASTER
jgi:queuosine precursor transporter